jgi:hypothetical protein
MQPHSDHNVTTQASLLGIRTSFEPLLVTSHGWGRRPASNEKVVSFIKA